MPSTTASAPRVADGEAHPRPADEVEPAAGRAVQHGVAGDRLGGGVGAEVGLGGDRDRAARQALGDVVVGLAGEPELDAGPGEGTERLAGGAAKVEPDGPVELAALEGAGEPGTERAIRRRDAETGGRDRPLAAERRRDADFERRRGRVADLATGTGRVRATGGRGAPRRGADDRRQLGPGDRQGREQPPALADDLADGPRARPPPARAGRPRRWP